MSASAERASLLGEWTGSQPVHLGVLLGNVPEYLFWLGAAALAGAVVVGINPTRRGAALAGDIRRTDCTVLITDAEGARLLDGLSFGVPEERVVLVDAEHYADRLAPHRGADPRSAVERYRPTADSLYLLLFTSGTTGAPKAVRCTQGRLASIAARSAPAYGYERDDVAYCTMPLFHGNALMVPWVPSSWSWGRRWPWPAGSARRDSCRCPTPRCDHVHLRGEGAGLRAGHAPRRRRRHHAPSGIRDRSLHRRPRCVRAAVPTAC